MKINRTIITREIVHRVVRAAWSLISWWCHITWCMMPSLTFKCYVRIIRITLIRYVDADRFPPRWLLTRRGSVMTRALSVCCRQIIIRVWHLVFTLLRRWYDLRANKIIFAIAVMRRGITILCNLCSIDILLHRIAALRLVCDNCGGKLVRRDGLYVIFSRWHH